jgi:peptide/nickel transport system substrate-binding protein
LRPDGKTLSVAIEYVAIEGPMTKIAELVKDYWEDVGMQVTLKEEERSYYQQRGLANEGEVRPWLLGQSFETAMWQNPRRFRPPWHNPRVVAGGKLWWDWYASNGESGEEPPEIVKRLFEVTDEWQQTVPGTEEYMKLGKEILRLDVENLFKIGTVGMPPRPAVAKNSLRNVTDYGMYGSDTHFFGPFQPCQWYYR